MRFVDKVGEAEVERDHQPIMARPTKPEAPVMNTFILDWRR